MSDVRFRNKKLPLLRVKTGHILDLMPEIDDYLNGDYFASVHKISGFSIANRRWVYYNGDTIRKRQGKQYVLRFAHHICCDVWNTVLF